MNEIVTATLYAAGDVQAKGIFDTIDSLALNLKDTILIVFGAIFYVGALFQAARAKFSAGSIIVGLIMVGIGTAVLGQMDAVQGLFSDTIEEETAQAAVTAAPAELSLEEPVVIRIEDIALAV